jgi:hypothetical protein
MRGKFNLAALQAADLVATVLIAISAQAATPTMATFFARRDYPGLFSNFVQMADTNGPLLGWKRTPRITDKRSKWMLCRIIGSCAS